MKNEEYFLENMVAPAPKLFGNEIVRHRNGNESGATKLQRRKVLFPNVTRN